MPIGLASGSDSGWAIAAVAGFILVLAFTIWLGLRQRRGLYGWLDDRIRSEGWVAAAGEAAIASRGWLWLRELQSARGVAVDHLVTNAGSGVAEAAFVLVTRRYGERLGARRVLGAGLIARLPQVITPPMIVVTAGADSRFFRWFLALDLPSVPVSDPRLRQYWGISSPDPCAAAKTIERNARLRAALVAAFEDALRAETKFLILILEFHGDAVTLLGGPKMVGRQPFSDLEGVARLLTTHLTASTGSQSS